MLTLTLTTAVLLYSACVFIPIKSRRCFTWLLALAWAAHSATLGQHIFESEILRVSFADMLSAALWISVAVYWVENRSIPLDGMRFLILPCAVLVVALPVFFPGKPIILGLHTPFFALHIGIAVLAYGNLTIAVFHALLMQLQESWLHRQGEQPRHPWLENALEQLPPLMRMEKLLFHFITIGFTLLTLTILSGLVSKTWLSLDQHWNHKTIFTLLSWLLFGLLLAGRRWRGWRGKLAVRLTLAGFTALLLAYVGSRFIIAVVLQRGSLL